MKKAILLAGLLALSMPGGCVLAVEHRTVEGQTGDRRQNVRLLQEKLSYLREIESKLQKNVMLARSRHEDGFEADVSLQEVQLLEARARRVDCELQLASWRARKNKSSKSSKSSNGSKSK